ncbi:VWA domain-containing protein [Nocardia ninae]
MRGVLAREAQRAAGAIPTAQPFTRTTRKPVPTPPLRVGIACDVSGSMDDYTADAASAAWIIATAADQAVMPARTATLTFERNVLPVTYPGAAPQKVTDFAATGMYEAIDIALDALDGALGLSQPENTRLLVIISDGAFRDEPRAAAQQRLNRLRASGCAVLWLTPDSPWSNPLTGATVHELTNPADTAAAIARAAVAAVRAA